MLSTKSFKVVDAMRKRPLLFNSMVYGFFYTSAEFIRQSFTKPTTQMVVKESETLVDTKGPILMRIQKICKILDLVDEKKDTATRSTRDYNWPQLKRYAVYGCFLAGPVLHGWYKWLDTYYSGKSTRIVLKKLFADQFIFTPPLLVLFFTSMSLMEAKSDIFRECQIKFPHTFQTSCGFWLPVQLVNFLLVPASLRVTYVGVAGFCWVNILCYLKNAPVVEHIEDKGEQ
ncbi:Uncharacterized protein FKSG24-like protein [Harpegnathos saltator]|uniref:Uncharacterized protein FKSG24-like protein n=1 Tax=Harpegnathos saltator TaxID=610380 RepID=E2C8N6_HARSA|nr:Uncharacterized protein FKSG24-like protein [Harpegnathos saltator]